VWGILIMLYAVKHSLAVIASDFLLHPMQAHTESITRSPACRSPSQTLKTKEIPHRADHHPCVLFPVAFTTTNLNSNT
ncbi:MAG: hypothetical protein ACRCTT_22455, partial [Enterobacter roggenkampii]